MRHSQAGFPAVLHRPSAPPPPHRTAATQVLFQIQARINRGATQFSNWWSFTAKVSTKWCEAVFFIKCPSRVLGTLGRAHIRRNAAACYWSQTAANRVERRRVLTVEVGDSRVGAAAVLARRALRAALRGTTGSSAAAATGAAGEEGEGRKLVGRAPT